MAGRRVSRIEAGARGRRNAKLRDETARNRAVFDGRRCDRRLTTEYTRSV
jgi:hypothetical protein